MSSHHHSSSTVADALNRALDPGDQITVTQGATTIATGAFISAADQYLVFVDTTGHYRIQTLTGGVGVTKLT